MEAGPIGQGARICLSQPATRGCIRDSATESAGYVIVIMRNDDRSSKTRLSDDVSPT